MFFLVKMYLLLNTWEIKRETMSTTRVYFQERPASPHSQLGGQWAALPLHTVRWSPFLQVMPPREEAQPGRLTSSTSHATLGFLVTGKRMPVVPDC